MVELPERDYSAFIFDCDGTLVDSMPLHQKAWILALQAHGAGFEFTWELFMRRAGMTLERTVEELNVEFGVKLDPRRVAEYQRAEYERLIDRIQPIEEVVRFARSRAGAPMAVASGGDRPTVERSLAAIGVTELFPVVVVAADVVRGKPDPDLFLLAAERLRVRPEDCLVFEDSPSCVDAARRAGMGAVLVSSTPPAAKNRS
jgi:HAD superfamily hydrolase (TIGR01509 family)